MDETFGYGACPLIYVVLGEDDCELIASKAGHRIQRASCAQQAACNVLKQAIACRMSQRIVDLFESIEIEN